MTFARLRTTHAVDSQPSVTSTTHVENTELGEQLQAQLLLVASLQQCTELSRLQ
jgi:hypothetical protein